MEGVFFAGVFDKGAARPPIIVELRPTLCGAFNAENGAMGHFGIGAFF